MPAVKRNIVWRWVVAIGAVLVLAGCFGDGTHRVGTGDGEVRPGLYRTAGGGASCSWTARTPNGSTRLQGGGAGPSYVWLGDDDEITSQACGTWLAATEDGPDPVSTRRFGDGEHLVFYDIEPGWWLAERPGAGCSYAHLGYPSSPDRERYTDLETSGSYVRLGPDGRHDFRFFETEGCGTWTKAAPPFGNLEVVSRVGNRLRLRGWIIDPVHPDQGAVFNVEDPQSIIYGYDRATLPRPDVAQAYPWAGPDHGFDVTFELQRPATRICLYSHRFADGALGAGTIGCADVG
jgi:hypothetical protein